ncbi:MAG: putative cytosol aminopeptidase, partial [Amnibacterium sp.]|nr:putative cytosol aminopeptidase [Amnibacterium sp.]
MPIPTLLLSSAAPATIDADVLVLAVRGGDATAELALPPGVDAATLGLAELDLAALGVSAAAGDIVRLPAPAGVAAGTMALVGLGAA